MSRDVLGIYPVCTSQGCLGWHFGDQFWLSWKHGAWQVVMSLLCSTALGEKRVV